MVTKLLRFLYRFYTYSRYVELRKSFFIIIVIGVFFVVFFFGKAFAQIQVCGKKVQSASSRKDDEGWKENKKQSLSFFGGQYLSLSDMQQLLYCRG